MTGIPEAKNRGISGDDTSGILYRIDEIIEGKPKKVFIMCGINDIQKGHPINQAISKYSEILSIISQKSPNTHVYVQSILPINPQKYRLKILPDHPYIHIPDRSEVIRFNKSISKLTLQYRNYQFIDLSSLVNSNGDLCVDFTDDGLHLNAKGMQAWVRSLRQYLN